MECIEILRFLFAALFVIPLLTLIGEELRNQMWDLLEAP